MFLILYLIVNSFHRTNLQDIKNINNNFLNKSFAQNISIDVIKCLINSLLNYLTWNIKRKLEQSKYINEYTNQFWIFPQRKISFL